MVKKWPWPSILTYLHNLNWLSASTKFQVTGCNSFWKIHCFHFFPLKSISNQIWPCHKIGQGNSKVIIWTIMMCWSPQCYIPSFVEIRPPVPKKMIFKGFLPYMGMVAIMVMWPASCHQIFISLYLKALIQSLVQINTVVSEKIQFEFLYVHDLGPR